MNKITDDIKEQVKIALAAGISEDAMKHVTKATQSIMDTIEGDLMYRLKDELAPNLASYVSEMCARTIDAILKGNESEIRRYLNCEQGHFNGRSDGDTWRPRPISEQHPIIHGKLHENSHVALRHELVDAHRDLITSERILDLEDQIKSLVAQVNKANAEKDAMWERVRALS